MVVGEVAERAHVVVIGGGPGGYAAAIRCADLTGKRVILVERDAVGGVCLNVGCIPSKVLIHAAERAHAATVDGTGVTLTADIDAAAMHSHRTEVVAQLTGGVRTLLDAAGVEVWPGEARFSRPDRLAVVAGPDVRHLEFDHVVLATGSRPTTLPHLPVDGTRVLDSTGALALTTVPDTMVVVGGGYIGVELGTAWAKLGATVHIVEAAGRLLPAMDRRLGSEVRRRLRTLGVTVHTGRLATELTDTDVVLDDGTALPADTVLVAVGRTPNTDTLGLDQAGVTPTDTGHLVVGPDRRVTGRIYAIGDVTAGPALAHKATAEAEVVAEVIAGRVAAFDPAAIPEVVFCDPEIASVGHSPESATAAGIEHTVFRFPYAAGSRSRTVGDTAGFVQLVADTEETIIGAQLAGHGVTELIAECGLAIEMAATVTDVAATVHAHPTMAEAVGEAALGLAGHPLHVRR